MQNDHPKKPSEHIENAVRSGGSIAITCELCGREHFASASPGYFDEGELEGLQEKAKANPEKYLEDAGSDDVTWGVIAGKQTVIGCPCNGLRPYEDFIWQNRHVIAKYLERRAKDNLEDAQSDVEIAERTKKATRQG